MATFAVGLLAIIIAVAAGWPYWREHAAFAAINVGESAALVVAGALLANSRTTRRCGLLFVIGGLSWSLTWLMSWDTGVLPLVSGFGQSVFWLTLGWGLLIYPASRLRSWLDRCWVLLAAVIVLGGQGITVVTSLPQWNGFSADVVWPAPFLVDRQGFDHVLDSLLVSYIVVSATFIALALHRIRMLRGLERAVAAPVLLSAGIVALVAAVTYPDLLSTPRLERVEDAIALQGAASVLAPAALLTVGIRHRLAAATAADRLLRAVHPPSVVAVRDALRAVLRDDSLDVHYWVADQNCFVDLDGRPVVLTGPEISARDDGRWFTEVRSPAGEVLAVVNADPLLRRHRAIVDAALSAGSLALENAQLQSALRAQLVQLADAQRRVAEVEARERVRIERDLHDGVQQRLIALDMTAGAVDGMITEPAAVRVIGQLRQGLREAQREVRDVARGLTPTALGQDGLRQALVHVAGNLRLPATLDVVEGRFGAAAERAMYFALTEAMTNVAKHAHARSVQVRVQAVDGTLVGEVVDDGLGGADYRVGGGISGVADRVRTVGGTLDLTSSPGDGTRMRVTMPCA